MKEPEKNIKTASDTAPDTPLDIAPVKKGKDKAKSEAAKDRVAEALRANLRRRKAQSRDRRE